MKTSIRHIIIPIAFLCLFLCTWDHTVIAQELSRTSSFAGQWPYHPGKAIAIDSKRELLYLGDGDTLNILDFDLNFISSVIVTESSQVGGTFFSAADNRLYIACRTEGLKIYDLTVSETPFEITSFMPDSREIMGVFIEGSKAFLSSGIDGIIILDISDIKNPFVLSQSLLPGGFGISYAIDIYVSGDFAFAADLYNGLHIIDISDPENPDYKKGIAIAGATDIAVSDNYLYLTTQGSGMAILDISTPEDTSVVSLFDAKGVASSVRVDGNFAFVSYSSFGIRALDITDKTEPFHDPAWVYDASGGSSLGLPPGKNVIFVADDQFGLQKIDITYKSNMQSRAFHDTPADAVSIDVSGNFIYAVDDMVGNTPGKEGLRVYQISASSQVTTFSYKGFCATPGQARDVVVVGDYAYIADGDQGMQIVNILDKTNPGIAGSFDTSGTATGIFIDAGFAYIADGNQGITIIDIRDKTAPFLVSVSEIDGSAEKIYVSGDYAYVTAGKMGVYIINISSKGAPVIAGTYDTPGTASGIWVFDDYAYVADGEKGILIIDITDKTAPILTGDLDTIGFAENISVTVDIACVADGANGLCSIDVSNPSQPTLIDEWSYNSPGIATDVFSGYFTDDEESYAFIADSASGIVAVNLSIEEDIYEEDKPGSSGGGCFIESAKKKSQN